MSDQTIKIDHFNIANLEDEIRVDQLCVALLQRFCRHLTDAGRTPEEAGSWARGADYFLRDFIVADRRENLFRISHARISQFGGNWYIIRNLEPNLKELAEILGGVSAFYAFAADQGWIERGLYESVATACRDLDFYDARIETFWAISGDGYTAWDALCPLTP